MQAKNNPFHTPLCEIIQWNGVSLRLYASIAHKLPFMKTLPCKHGSARFYFVFLKRRTFSNIAVTGRNSVQTVTIVQTVCGSMAVNEV